MNKVFFPRLPKNGGFTLIEIAIVLVIIGLLVALGVALIGPLTKRAKYIETKEIVNAGVESVISRAAANNRIPTAPEFPTVVRNPRDDWGKSLYYIPDPNLDDLLAGGVCGRRTTGTTVRNCTNVACTTFNDIANVAFLVISGSENYNIQTSKVNGMVKVYVVGTENIDDCTTEGNCPNYPPAELIDRPEYYDDIVKWITLDELRIKAGCVGAQLEILNTELPYGYVGSTYSATVFADGGVPFLSGGRYKWCRQGTVPGLTFTPGNFSTDCLRAGEELWVQRDNLTISGTPTSAGSYTLTFFVRDNNDTVTTGINNDNIAQRALALTISPPPPCASYRVWNLTGAIRDFRVDGACRNDVGDTIEITTATLFLRPGGVINRHAASPGVCPGSILQHITFEAARDADANLNCQVNFRLDLPPGDR